MNIYAEVNKLICKNDQLIDRQSHISRNLKKGFKQLTLKYTKGTNQLLFEDNGADQQSNRQMKVKSIFQIQSSVKRSQQAQPPIKTSANFDNIQLQRNNMRWTSLPAIMKAKTETILNLKKVIDEVSIKETSLFSLVQKCRDTTDVILNESIPLSQEELQGQQIKCLNAFQSHVNLLFVMILKIQKYNQTQELGHIHDIAIATKNKNFEYHFREERFQALIHQFAFTIKYPQVIQESTFKVANLAIKSLENLVNQGGLKHPIPQPQVRQQQPIVEQREKSAFEDVEMDEDAPTQIDTSIKAGNKPKFKSTTSDVTHQKSLTSIISSDQISTEIKANLGKVHTIHEVNHRLQKQLQFRVLVNTNYQMDDIIIKNLSLQFNQQVKWYFAKLKNKLWNELDIEEKNEFKLFITPDFTKINLNIQKLTSGNTMIVLYVDAKRYGIDQLKNQIFPHLQQISMFRTKPKSVQMGGAHKIELKFKMGEEMNVFLYNWHREKVTNSKFWKGVTRWKRKKILDIQIKTKKVYGRPDYLK